MIISRVTYHTTNSAKQNTHKKKEKRKIRKTRQQKKAKYASRVHPFLTEDQ